MKNNIKSTIFYVMLIACMFQNFYAVEKTATNITKSSLETIGGSAFDGVAAAAPYIGAVHTALSIGMEIKSHTFPNEEEKARAVIVAERYAFLVAEKEFQSCMRKNIHSPERDVSGAPTTCKDITQMLIMLGGQDEVRNLTLICNEIRK